MKTLLRTTALTGLFASSLAFAGTALEGRWDAKLVRNDSAVPFRLDI